MDLTSPDNVLHLVARLSAVGVCLACLELLTNGGGRGKSPPDRAARWGAGAWHVGLPALVLLRLVLAAVLLSGLDVGVSWKVWVVGLLLVSLLVRMLLPLTQGADTQLHLIIYSAIALTLVSDTPTVACYCLYFLTLQLCLAYFAAGYHKLRCPEWRGGSALPGILSTRVFGSPAFAAWLGRHRGLARSSALAVVAWEVSFPVVLVAPPAVCLGYLACGVLFHLGTAFTMGLNKFVWAFFALYPAVVYCTTGSLLVAR